MRTTTLIVFVLLLLIATFFFGRYSNPYTDPYEITTDTIIRIDTVRDVVPRYIDRDVVRVDSIPYYVTTTDTVYVQVPIERKEYRTVDYYAVVEGYKSELVEIETYNKTMFIDRVETYKAKSRWGLGLQLGFGYGEKVSPYIGVGLQYNLVTW